MELSSKNIIQAGFAVVFDGNDSVSLSLKDVKNEVTFTLLENVTIDLTIKNFDSLNAFTFFVNKNSHLNVHIVNDDFEKEFVLHANLQDDAEMNVYFADLAKANTIFNSNIVCLGNNSKSTFRFCSVANKDITKKYNIGFDQIGTKTSTLFEGYGVSLKNGLIDARGISHIEKDSVKSIANQKIKVILFDKESKAKASPTLRIDCDDISANHACAIGSLNEDHIFYLKSRGLTEEESRKLITMGYLIPIEDYFLDDGKEKINSYIKEIF